MKYHGFSKVWRNPQPADTIYSKLKGRSSAAVKPDEDMWRGTWNGELVEFDRNFRGHYFSDEECMALCRGEMLEVHNLGGQRGMLYAVRGMLQKMDMGIYSYVTFKQMGVVANDPNCTGMRIHKQVSPLQPVKNPEPSFDEALDVGPEPEAAVSVGVSYAGMSDKEEDDFARDSLELSYRERYVDDVLEEAMTQDEAEDMSLVELVEDVMADGNADQFLSIVEDNVIQDEDEAFLEEERLAHEAYYEDEPYFDDDDGYGQDADDGYAADAEDDALGDGYDGNDNNSVPVLDLTSVVGDMGAPVPVQFAAGSEEAPSAEGVSEEDAEQSGTDDAASSASDVSDEDMAEADRLLNESDPDVPGEDAASDSSVAPSPDRELIDPQTVKLA